LFNFKNRLLNLALGELVAACSFIYLYRVSNLGTASLISFSLLVFILLQGSVYWIYRYRIVKRRKSVSNGAIKLLSVARKLNMVLILGVVMSILKLMTGDKDLLVAIGVLLFTIIEYINYYWYRLSYGKSGFNIIVLMNTGLQKSSIDKLINKQI